MAFKKAERFGGGFLDLKALADNGPVLVLFRVTEFHEVEKSSTFDGWTFPVQADALICSGEHRGETHLDERFIGAITSALRGVQNARKNKNEKPQPPVNEVGDLVLARVEVINKGQGNASAVGNVPSDADEAAAEALYVELGGGDVVWAPKDTDAQQPATAGAGAGGSKRPW